MATLHRVRVAAVGTKDEMCRLCRVLLSNCDALPPEDERPEFTLEELRELILKHTHENSDPSDTFLYEMISSVRFGEAVAGSCRMNIREENCGLWTACFAYDSEDPFQTHEWLDLNNRSGVRLMVAQRASHDFGLDKGEVLLVGGTVLDNWDYMNECWLWLVPQYECGYPPQEAVSRLEKLAETMEREDADMTVPELLRSCMENLTSIAAAVEDPENVCAVMRDCLEKRDFDGLLEMYHLIAESVLWETEHNAKWLACLDSVLQAWEEKHAEG